MPLHPTISKFIAGMPAPEGDLNPNEMRLAEELNLPPESDKAAMHSIVDRTLSTEYGDVPVRMYFPNDKKVLPILVYFHGGAFFLGSLNTHDQLARQLAKASECLVISVDYRLAPENVFPAGLDDCYGVVRWIAEQKEAVFEGVYWDQQNLIVCGDSSGANFAAAVSARAYDDDVRAISHQVLFYPSLDLDFDGSRYESLRSNAVGNGLETAMLKPFNDFYFQSGANPKDPLVSPIKRTRFDGLPPALIITAECDPLRDEGELYGYKLEEAGVPCEIIRYESAGHGFIQYFAWLPEFADVFAKTANFIKGKS